MIKLRPYQQEAVEAMLLTPHMASLVVLPTGSGKSVIQAEYIHRLDKPSLILQPSKEILRQNKNKLLRYVDKNEVGVYSASFNSKEIKRYTFATIQSIYKKTRDFFDFRHIIIDECHLYKQRGMFDKFIDKFLVKPKIIGLTATPFRIEQKKETHWGSRTTVVKGILRVMQPNPFTDIIYTISTKELMDQGYLCKLEYKDEAIIPANFHKKSDKQMVDEYILQLTFGKDKLNMVEAEIARHKSVIVFCPSVSIAQRMESIHLGSASAVVHGKTPKKERDWIIQNFIDGYIQVVYNVGVLTTGFDHPSLDCIVLFRPTKSLTLYNQILGRGTRIYEGKTKCTVFDPTGTVKQLGKLEDIVIKKDEYDIWNVWTEKGWMRNKQVSYYKTRY